MKNTLKVIRFEIHRPESSDVNRLPKGIRGNKKLMMWKELCRTGDYKTDGQTHHITLEFFQNMINSFKERLAKGVEVPCPKGHNHDPENKRGRVLHLEIRPNDEGYSLWGIIEFIDPQAKKLLQNSDVSIDSPEELVDGDGTTYRYALEHVAFTDYPVVAGMEGFQDVKFSVIKETFDERWNIDLLLNKLGLVGDYGTPSDAYRAIYDKFLAVTGKAKKQEGKKSGASRDSDFEEEGERQMSKRMAKKRRKFDTDELGLDELKEEEVVDFGDEGDEENELDMACKSMAKSLGKKKFGEEKIEEELSEEEGEDEFDLDEEFDLGEDDEFDLDEDEELDLDDEDEFDLDDDEELDLDEDEEIEIDEEEFGLDDEDDEFDLDEDDEFELEDEDEFGLDDEDEEFDLDDEEEFDLDEDEEFGLDEDDEEEALGLSTRRRKLAKKRKSCGKRFSRGESRLIRENRSMKIDALRRAGYINASQSNNLKRQFCANGISFSRDSEAEFNRIVDFAKSGPRTDYREHTGVQFGFKKDSNILENAVSALYQKKK